MTLKVVHRLISEGIIEVVEGASKHGIYPAETAEITIKFTGQPIINGEQIEGDIEGVGKLNAVLLAMQHKKLSIEILSFSD